MWSDWLWWAFWRKWPIKSELVLQLINVKVFITIWASHLLSSAATGAKVISLMLICSGDKCTLTDTNQAVAIEMRLDFWQQPQLEQNQDFTRAYMYCWIIFIPKCVWYESVEVRNSLHCLCIFILSSFYWICFVLFSQCHSLDPHL